MWPWVSGGSQVRFCGLQMGVVVGLRCVWNGLQRFTMVEVLWVFLPPVVVAGWLWLVAGC